MKKLTFLLLLLSLSSFAQKKLTPVTVGVNIFMSEEEQLYCGVENGLFFLSKKAIVFKSSKVQIDMKVLRRNIGKYDSWLGFSQGIYYFVTPLRVNGEGLGMMFQPVEFNLMRRHDTPVIVISTVDICD